MTNPLAYSEITPTPMDEMAHIDPAVAERVIERFATDSAAFRNAAAALNEFTRASMREESAVMRILPEPPGMTIPMATVPNQTILGRPVEVPLYSLNEVANVATPAQVARRELTTPYQDKLLELRPEPSDVWGNPTDPHDWHVVTYWSASHIECAEYSNEYTETLTPEDFWVKILDDGWQLVYRHPGTPGAELARLNLRSETELIQAAPVPLRRRALRLRNQEREVVNDDSPESDAPTCADGV